MTSYWREMTSFLFWLLQDAHINLGAISMKDSFREDRTHLDADQVAKTIITSIIVTAVGGVIIVGGFISLVGLLT